LSAAIITEAGVLEPSYTDTIAEELIVLWRRDGWWRWWESNPRPRNASESFYVRSLLFVISLLAVWKRPPSRAASPVKSECGTGRPASFDLL
jgi:hypothetical protein